MYGHEINEETDECHVRVRSIVFVTAREEEGERVGFAADFMAVPANFTS